MNDSNQKEKAQNTTRRNRAVHAQREMLEPKAKQVLVEEVEVDNVTNPQAKRNKVKTSEDLSAYAVAARTALNKSPQQKLSLQPTGQLASLSENVKSSTQMDD